MADGGMVDIAEGNIALVIEAARDHRAVDKDAEVVAESVAEHLRAHIIRLHIGPIEAVTVFEVQFMADSCAARGPFPLARKARAENVEGTVISAAVVSLVPQA